MDKNQILKGLDDVKRELGATKDKLANLVSQPIWSTEVYPALDSSVGILQELSKKIKELSEIQKNILNKP